MVNDLVFRWPKPLFFMVLGAHGIYIYRYKLREKWDDLPFQLVQDFRKINSILSFLSFVQLKC